MDLSATTSAGVQRWPPVNNKLSYQSFQEQERGGKQFLLVSYRAKLEVKERCVSSLSNLVISTHCEVCVCLCVRFWHKPMVRVTAVVCPKRYSTVIQMS